MPLRRRSRSASGVPEILEVRTLLAAGDLDPSFTGDITHTVPFNIIGTPESTLNGGVAIQKDGKVVIVSSAATRNNVIEFNTVVSRLGPSGVPDVGFGTNGQLEFDSTVEQPYSSFYKPGVLVQPDQKIVVFSSNGVRRLSPSGSLDSSFSGDGAIALGNVVTGIAADPRDVLPSAGNRLLVLAGRTLHRLLNDGTPDPAFDGDGQVEVGTADESGAGLIALSGGRVLVVTTIAAIDSRGDPKTLIVRRFGIDGALDASYGTNGRFEFVLETPFDFQGALAAATPDGKLYLTGVERGASNSRFVAIRVTQAGALDLSFAGSGKQSLEIGPVLGVKAVVLPDLRLAVGYGTSTNYEGWKFLRLLENGNLDTQFGTAGTASLTFAGNTAKHFVTGLVFDPDRSALFSVGYGVDSSRLSVFPAQTGFIAKIELTGHLSSSFSGDGLARTIRLRSGSGLFGPKRLSATDASGKTVSVVGGSSIVLVARYQREGALDASFGSSGFTTVAIDGSGLHTDFEVSSVATTSDGGVLVAGRVAQQVRTDGSLGTGFILRLNADGTVYTGGVAGYRSDGVLLLGQFRRVTRLLSTADGNILVAGDGFGSEPDPTIIRLDGNGTSLGQFPVGDPGTAEKSVHQFQIRDLAETPDGKFIAVGQDSGLPAGLVRWFGNGTIDQGFERIRRFAITTSSFERPHRILVRPDGKILVLSHEIKSGSSNGVSSVVVRRYNEDGTDDQTFGIRGEARIRKQWDTFGNTPVDMELFPDGSVAVTISVARADFISGQIKTSSTYVYRLTADGFPDEAWNASKPGSLSGHDGVLDFGMLGDSRLVLTTLSQPEAPFQSKRVRIELGARVQTLVSKAILTTTETGAAATFEVRLSSQPTANVTIPVASSDSTEGTVSVNSLTFTPDNWSTAQSVTITGVDDALFDADQRYRIVLGPATSTDPDYNGKAVRPVEVRNRDDETLRFFRAYNPQANFHFFTTSVSEFQGVQPNGYNDESSGRGGFSLVATAQPGFTQLFRLYNLQKGYHYYTASAGERDFLLSLNPPSNDPNFGKVGWRFEGSPGFIADTQQAGTNQVFRLYNKTSGAHLFTENPAVRAAVLQSPEWEEHAPLGFAFLVDDAEPLGATASPPPPVAASVPEARSTATVAREKSMPNVASLVALPSGSRSILPAVPAAADVAGASSSAIGVGDEFDVAALDAYLESLAGELVGSDL